MVFLRWLGLIFGLALLGSMLLRSVLGRERVRKLDLLIVLGTSGSLVLISLYPNLLNGVLGWLSFETGGGRRLIGLLILSNFLVYALIFRLLVQQAQVGYSFDRLIRELAKREFGSKHPGERDAPIVVVIPAYNEADNIDNVLECIPPEVLGLPTEVIVVVDGATDDTEARVRARDAAALVQVINRGGGSALRAGYDVAISRGAEVVVTLDADGQHLPEEIPSLVKPILEGEVDLVNGSRVLGHYERDSHIRAAGVVLFNWLVSLLTMTRITDCSNAFRAIRASELAKLELRQSQFHTSELLIEAFKKGLRVKEVPITVKRRLSGESKKGPTFKYAWGFTRAIIGTWLR